MTMISGNSIVSSIQRCLGTANAGMLKSIERLSTGSKINSASDDAAGLSIATNLTTQIRGLSTAKSNTKQAIDLLSLADSALQRMQASLQKLRELSVKAANGIYGTQEREAMQQEATALTEEIVNIKNTTNYNNIKVFEEVETTSSTETSSTTSSTDASSTTPTLASTTSSAISPLVMTSLAPAFTSTVASDTGQEDSTTDNETTTDDETTLTEEIATPKLMSSPMKLASAPMLTSASPNRSVTYQGNTYTATSTSIGSTTFDKITINSSDYYLVDTKEQLQAIQTESASGSLSNNYILMADIDLQEGNANYTDIANALDADKSSYTAVQIGNLDATLSGYSADTWTAIGTSTNQFAGHFDGNGYTVSHMYINENSSYHGLFGSVGSSGIIENINVENSLIYLGAGIAGGIAGDNAGTISKSNVENLAVMSWVTGGQMGGITGQNSGTVDKCYTLDSSFSAYDNLGGVVGYNSSVISNCYARNVRIDAYDYGGGMVGTNSGNVTNSYVYAATVLDGDGCGYCSYFEGFDGYGTGSHSNCYFDDTSTVNGGTSTAGAGDCQSAGWFGTNSAATALGSAYELSTGASFVTLVDNPEESTTPARTFTYKGNTYNTTTTTLSGTSLDIDKFEKDGDDYYIIDTMEQLQAINTSSTTLGYNYVLGADIDMQSGKSSTITDALDADKTGYTSSQLSSLASTLSSSGANTWTAIGNSTNKFTGYFDGNGHEIEHLFINSTSDYQGLFGDINFATIENVTLTNSFVYSTGNYVGGIIGYSDNSTGYTSISGSQISYSSVTNSAIYGGNGVGSIAGGSEAYNDEYEFGQTPLDIRESYSTDTIIHGNISVGGIAGSFDGMANGLTSCYVNNNTVSGTDYVAGLISTYTSFYGCYVTNSEITGTNEVYATCPYSDINSVVCDVSTTVNGTQGTVGSGNCYADSWFATSSALSTLDEYGSSYYEIQTGATRPTLINNPEELTTPTRTFTYKGNTYNTTTTTLSGTSLSIDKFEKDGSDYYIIDTMEQLQAINTSSTTLGYNYVLGADIDMQEGNANYTDIAAALDADKTGYNASDLTNLQTTLVGYSANTWTAIGDDTNQFTGYFDGNGYEIEHMFINNNNTSSDYQGLFGYVSGATIENVAVTNSFVYSTGDDAGTVVGCLDSGSTISSSAVTNSAIYGKYYVGSIAGDNDDGTIENSYSKDCIIYAPYGRVGGIAGTNGGTIQNTYTNNNTVIGEGTHAYGITDIGNTINCYVTNGTIVGNVYTGAVSQSSSTNTYYDEATTINGTSETSGRTYRGATCESASWFASSAAVTALGAEYSLQTDAARPTLVDNVETDVESYTPTRTFNYRGTYYTATQTQLTGTSLDIYTFEKDGADYYIIDTMEQLQAINTSSTTLGYNYVLGADIDMQSGKSSTVTDALDADKTGYTSSQLSSLASTLSSSGANTWTAIGDGTNQFTGYFDGNGYEIEHLFINDTTSGCQGLFGVVEGGTLENVKVSNSFVSASCEYGSAIGTIAGSVTKEYASSGGVLSQCVVENSAVYGHSIGTMVGSVGYDAVVEKSYSKNSIACSFGDGGSSGGIANFTYNGAVITNSYTNNNTVTATGNSTTVSGIVNADMSSGTISNTYVTNGTITGTSAYALADSSYISNSYYDEATTVNGSTGTAGSGDCQSASWFASSSSVTALGSAYTLQTNAARPTLVDNVETDVESYTPTRTFNYKGTDYTATQTQLTGTSLDIYKFEKNGADYYIIDTMEQLQAINTSSTTLGYNYVLGADIDMQSGKSSTITEALDADKTGYTSSQLSSLASTLSSSGANTWTAIGNSTNAFTGYFDGNGYEIDHLFINSTSIYQGLFGYTSGADIENISINNAFVYSTDGGIGAISGYSASGSTITSSDVTNSAVCGQISVGGIVGVNDGTIETSYSKDSIIYGTGSYATGGIAGNNGGGTIQNTYTNNNTVTGAGNYVGGITGYGGAINSYVTNGTITGSSSTYTYVVSGSTSTNSYFDEATTVNGVSSTSGTTSNGATCETASWFASSAAVTALGAEYSLQTDAARPTLVDNVETDVESYTPTRTFNYRGTDYTATQTQLTGTSLDIYKFERNGSDYYIIDTMEQLQAINTSSTTLGYNYVLGADIDMQSGKSSTVTDALDADKTGYTSSQLSSLASTLSSSGANTWTAIGNSTNAFTGYFDGNGHEIEHLFINDTTSGCQGLFGVVEGGTLENVKVSNSFVSASWEYGSAIGTIAGSVTREYASSGGVLSQCVVENSAVYGHSIGTMVGSVGYAAVVEKSYSKNSIACSFGDGGSSGGIANFTYNGAVITNSYTNNNTVTATGNSTTVSGIVNADMSSGTISNTYVTNGTITGTTADALADSSCISNSYYDEATIVNGSTGTAGSGDCQSASWFASSTSASTLGSAYTLQSGKARPTLVDNVETDVEPYTPTTRTFNYKGTDYTATQTQLTGTSLDIYKFERNGADYYIIDTMEQLQAINTSSTTLGYNYVLGADIDMQSGKSSTVTNALNTDKTGYDDTQLIGLKNTLISAGADTWTAIGTSSSAFTGYFDGNGYEIDHLFVNSTSSYQGLFGNIGNGVTVENVSVTNSFVYTTGSNTGIIAGQNAGNILCSYTSNSAVYSGGSEAGAISGTNSGTINKSYTKNSNIYAGGNNASGISGSNSGTISNSYTNNNTVETGSNYANGIASGGTITNCYVTNGTITGTNAYSIASSSTNSYYDKATTVNGTSVASDNRKTATWFASSDSVTALGSAYSLQTNAARPTLVDNVETDVESYTPSTRTFNYKGTDYTATQTQLTGTSLDIYKFEKDGSDYYIIDTMEQLQAIGTNSTTLGYKYVLATDIDMQSGKSSTITDALDADKTGYTSSQLSSLASTLSSSGANTWTAIGNSTNAFTGYFDGNGHEIEHLFINSTSDYQGLFGCLGSGSNVENVDINNSFVYTTGNQVGCITGSINSGTISASHVDNSAIYGNTNLGSISGNNYGTITTSYSKNSIIYSSASSSNNALAGGITGTNRGTISNTYTNNNTVTGISYVGGIVGSGSVTNSYVTNGTITGDSNVYAVSKHTSTNSYFDEATTVNGVSSTSGTTAQGSTCQSASWFASSVAVTALGAEYSLQTSAARPTLVDNVETDVESYTPTTRTFNYRGTDYTATQTQLTGTSLDIYTFEKDGSDYYIIDTMEQLQAIGTNSTTLGYNYVLGADIDMQSGKSSTITDALDADKTGYSASDLTTLKNNLVSAGANIWKAIGGLSGSYYFGGFKGYFDGNGYEIEHLFINSTSDDQGLFATMDSSTIENVSINNSFVYSTGQCVGGIVGSISSSSGTISTSHVNNSAIYGTYRLGSIAGYNYSGTITTSYSKDSIICAEGNEIEVVQVGGIVGLNGGNVENTYTNNNTVTGVAGWDVGGITGAGSATNSYVTNGTIIGDTTSTYAVSKSTSTNSYFDEATTVNGTSKTSGTTAQGSTCQSASWFASSDSVTALGSAYTLQTGKARPTLVDNVETDVEPYVPPRVFNYKGVNYETKTTTLSGTSLDIDKFTKDGDDYYIIDTMEQLQAINTSSTTLGYNYVLGADIDMQSGKSSTVTNALNTDKTGYDDTQLIGLKNTLISAGADTWTAIGTSSSAFTGYFDGNGYEIDHLFVNSTSSYQGLFGNIGNGVTVENVSVTNSFVYTTGSNTGIIAGQNAGNILCSYTSNSAVYSGGSEAGAISGANSGTINKSYTKNSNIYAGGNNASGISGSNSGTISNSYTNNNTIETGSNYANGIASGGTITNCYVTNGTITGTNAYSIASSSTNSYYDKATTVNGTSVASDNRKTATWFASSDSVTALGSAYSLQTNAARPTLVDNVETDVEPYTPPVVRKVTYKGVEYEAESTNIGSTDFDKIVISDQDYYLIDNINQLNAINTESAAGSLGNKYILMTNIDMQQGKSSAVTSALNSDKTEMNDTQLTSLKNDLISNGANTWNGIGTTSNAFTGYIDGNGFEISHVFVNSTSENSGLFNNVSGATIENISVKNSLIYSNSNSTGAIAGKATSSTITQSEVENSAIRGNSNIGALVGNNSSSTVQKSYSKESNINATGNYAGGLVGYSTGTTNNCYVNNNTVHSQTGIASGLVGHTTTTTSNSYVTNSTISGTSANAISDSTASNCYNDVSTTLNGIQGTAGTENCKVDKWFATPDAASTLGSAYELQSGAARPTLVDNVESNVEPAPTRTVTYKGRSYSATISSIGSTMFDKINIDGTDHYLVDDLDQLKAINTEKTNGSYSKHYILMNDMDLQQGTTNHDAIANLLKEDKTEYTEAQIASLESSLSAQGANTWTSIGDSSTAFTGSFDGNGYSISNMIINTSNNNQGFFGVTDGAKLENIQINNSLVDGENNVGAIAGLTNGNTTISTSRIENSAILANTKAGGLVGADNGNLNISESYASLNKIYSDNSTAGGLIGEFSSSGNSTITSSYSYKNNISAYGKVAGIVGSSNNGGNISRSYVYKNTIIDRSTSDGGYIVNPASTVNMTYAYYDNQTTLDGEEPELGGNCKSSYWFGTSSGVVALGGAYELQSKADHITLRKNSEKITEERKDPPPEETSNIQIQVGANSGEDDTVQVNTSFSMEGFEVDLSSQEKARNSIDQIDAMMQVITEKLSNVGVQENILESIVENQDIRILNYESSKSTIMDTDIAKEQYNLVSKQILANIASAMLVQIENMEQSNVLNLISGIGNNNYLNFKHL